MAISLNAYMKQVFISNRHLCCSKPKLLSFKGCPASAMSEYSSLGRNSIFYLQQQFQLGFFFSSIRRIFILEKIVK